MRFIQAENEEAVKIWDLEMSKETTKIVRPRFDLETYPNARAQLGADELTIRAEEKGTALAFLNMKEISYARWSPPLVDEDWHAVCQALNRSLEADEWSKDVRYV